MALFKNNIKIMEGFTIDKILCKGGCKEHKCLDDFGIKKNGNHYQHCKMCRNKKKKVTRIDEGISPNIIEDNIIEDNIIDDKKKEKKEKRENRPTISTQKQQLILKEQDYLCRGPGPNDNKEYECDMKVNGKKFSDRKSSEPQFDHIIRWKDGGNGIGNIQALCASCHLMKTSVENMINEDENAILCHRIKIIYESLTKVKYQETESSSDDDDDIYWNTSFKRRYRNLK